MTKIIEQSSNEKEVNNVSSHAVDESEQIASLESNEEHLLINHYVEQISSTLYTFYHNFYQIIDPDTPFNTSEWCTHLLLLMGDIIRGKHLEEYGINNYALYYEEFSNEDYYDEDFYFLALIVSPKNSQLELDASKKLLECYLRKKSKDESKEEIQKIIASKLNWDKEDIIKEFKSLLYDSFNNFVYDYESLELIELHLNHFCGVLFMTLSLLHYPEEDSLYEEQELAFSTSLRQVAESYEPLLKNFYISKDNMIQGLAYCNVENINYLNQAIIPTQAASNFTSKLNKPNHLNNINGGQARHSKIKEKKLCISEDNTIIHIRRCKEEFVAMFGKEKLTETGTLPEKSKDFPTTMTSKSLDNRTMQQWSSRFLFWQNNSPALLFNPHIAIRDYLALLKTKPFHSYKQHQVSHDTEELTHRLTNGLSIS